MSDEDDDPQASDSTIDESERKRDRYLLYFIIFLLIVLGFSLSSGPTVSLSAGLLAVFPY